MDQLLRLPPLSSTAGFWTDFLRRRDDFTSTSDISFMYYRCSKQKHFEKEKKRMKM
jgi:hypothetical protein